jgi:predicted amidohydrolase
MRLMIRLIFATATFAATATIIAASLEIPIPVKLRVAGAQIPVVQNVSANVAAIERAIAFAAAEKADVLLTPEGALSGYVHDFDQAAVARALDQVVAKAREVRLALALGVCFEEPEDHQRYDEIRFYDKDGAFVGFHAKILLCRRMSAPTDTPGEIDYFRAKPLRIFRFRSLPGLTFGGLICNDFWANPEWTPQADPHLTQQLAHMGAQVIFQSVNSGLGEGDELLLNRQFHDANLRIRARSGRQWIVVGDASDPASHRANQCYSGVVGPTGDWVVKTPAVGDQMFAHTIELPGLVSPR